MAQSVPPVRRTSFGGVFTSCTVFQRPGDTAIRCHNLRPMPGGALRLRGGWQRRLAVSALGGAVHHLFYEFRKGTFTGGVYHLTQLCTNGDPVAQSLWYSLNLQTWTEAILETGPRKDQYAVPLFPAAICTVRDRVFMDNGQGYRAYGGLSTPPISSWDGTKVRYVGLDAFYWEEPDGTAVYLPELEFIPNNGGFNNVQNGISIYVGLYNSATNHYSNGVIARVAYDPVTNRVPPITNATITVKELRRLKFASHGTEEQSEQFFVFYSTLDGFHTPYLILDATGKDVFKVPVTENGPISLSLTGQDKKGFFVSTAHEMPTTNFPPRPMSDMCYQNGRVYYIFRALGLPAGSSPAVPDRFGGFSYEVPDSDATAVGWSAAADDYSEAEFVGVPEESFPLTNKKYVPSGEVPLKISDLANRGQVLVITATHTYWLEEIAQNLHVFQRISENRGILDKRTFQKTPRGPMWVTQSLEIVLLHEDSMTLEVVSEDYAELLHHENYLGATFGVASDYLLDPVNMIDRYQVWASDGFFVIHDFWLEKDQKRRSVTLAPAYSGKAFPVTAAKTVRDAAGKQYHLTAEAAVWTQEGQPENTDVRTTDENANGIILEITGDYVSQWIDFGDPLLRKEITEFILTGDAAHSKQLNDRPVSLSWYGDLYTALPGVTDNIVALVKHDQSPTDWTWMGKVDAPHQRWIKYRCILRGHSQDGNFAYYPCAFTATGEFNVSDQVYATLAAVAITVNPAGGNR